MSHHSQEDQDRLAEELKDMRTVLGETGDFPEGKLTEHDEGGIIFALGVKDGKVILHFGKSVAWIGMNAVQARELAGLLEHRAEQAEKGMTVRIEDAE